jgi:tRNA (adenine57-N1/adenine58-N1)-methyltransferase
MTTRPLPLPQPNEVVLLVSPDHKRFIVRLAPGGQLHTHRGIVAHDDVLGAPIGGTVASHLDVRFTVLRPSLDELLLSLPRATQIIYPKEIGYLLLKLSIVPGARVIEAGSGSGVLTTALARYVTPGGHVYSYEARADMQALAAANLERVGLAEAVTLRLGEIEQGFDERAVDAVFLDVREPWLYLRQVDEALAPGGFFGTLVPTVNQVIEVVAALAEPPFRDVEVSELLLRSYKPVAERLRPTDRLTAHTGYLVFARKIQPV